MARITVDDCLHHIPNRFLLTLVCSTRARQIKIGGTKLAETGTNKATVLALREIAAGITGIEILTPPSSP